MRVDLDAKVRTRDGEDAGSVARVVIDPHANEVTHFVVDSGGLLGRRVLVPREEVERAAADGDAVRLGLSKPQLEQLPEFREADYLPPPTGWVPPVGLRYPYGGVVWPVGPIPGLMYPATAPTSAGADGTSQRPEPDQRALGKGAIVVDRNGDDVGVVDDVRFDPDTGELRGFVLRAGGMLRTLFGGGEIVEVDRQEIDRVDTELVHLGVDKETLRRGAGAAGAR